jgi:hypothetical protein
MDDCIAGVSAEPKTALQIESLHRPYKCEESFTAQIIPLDLVAMKPSSHGVREPQVLFHYVVADEFPSASPRLSICGGGRFAPARPHCQRSALPKGGEERLFIPPVACAALLGYTCRDISHSLGTKALEPRGAELTVVGFL